MQSGDTSFAGIILAGGKSARLGVDKAYLEVGGKPIIARVIDTLVEVCDEIIISTNDLARYSDLNAHSVPDIIPGGGALVGLYSSLKVMDAEYAIVTGCDMPFLSGDFIRHMVEISRDYDALIPVYNSYLEPLHSIYSKRCLGAIQKHVEAGHKPLRSFYEDVTIKYVDEETVKKFSPSGTIFFNVNTPEDLEKARSMYSNKQVM